MKYQREQCQYDDDDEEEESKGYFKNVLQVV